MNHVEVYCSFGQIILGEGHKSIYQQGGNHVHLLATTALYAQICLTQLFQLGQLAVKGNI